MPARYQDHHGRRLTTLRDRHVRSPGAALESYLSDALFRPLLNGGPRKYPGPSAEENAVMALLVRSHQERRE
jgi:hypothetical protein